MNTLRQRTEAKSVLLHHHDIQDLLRVCLYTHLNHSLTLVQENEDETIRVLTESGVVERVEIDENGGRSLLVIAWLISQAFTLGSWATGKPWNIPIFKAHLVVSWRWRCGRCQGTWSGEYRGNQSLGNEY